MRNKFKALDIVVPHAEIKSIIDNDTYDTVVQKIFWVSLQCQSTDLALLLEDIEEDCGLRSIFPEMDYNDIDHYLGSDMHCSLLVKYNKLGVIAQLETPDHCAFKVNDNGDIVSYATQKTIKIKNYVYGENGPDLFQKIIDVSKVEFQKSFERELSKKRVTKC